MMPAKSGALDILADSADKLNSFHLVEIANDYL
jgi:hypothetical protein